MYNTELAKEPTYDELISQLTEYDIFRQYIGSDFKLNQIMSSPLRTDKHPSFGVYKAKTGSLLFKDQATGDTGNCIHLVMKLNNITYRSALKKVWQDMILGRVQSTTIGKLIDKIKPITTTILVQSRKWCKFDDAYWSRYYITKEDLKLFNVQPIDRFWLNDVLQSYRYTSTEPMYAYQIFNKFKIYRPLSNKTDKWRSNAGLYDIQGYEQLPDKCDHIIITKSLKDIIVLRKLGYYAIAPNGENHTIPQVVIDKLRKNKGTTKFTVFYDNDEVGVLAGVKLANKLDCYTLQLRWDEPKDISDYVEKYGLEKAKQWIQQQF